jgi:hypothetical protein
MEAAFQTHGLEGLKDLPPVHKYHPQTTLLMSLKILATVPNTRWDVKLRLAEITRYSVLADSSKNTDQHDRGSRYERLLKRGSSLRWPFNRSRLPRSKRSTPVFANAMLNRPGQANCSARIPSAGASLECWSGIPSGGCRYMVLCLGFSILANFPSARFVLHKGSAFYRERGYR